MTTEQAADIRWLLAKESTTKSLAAICALYRLSPNDIRRVVIHFLRLQTSKKL